MKLILAVLLSLAGLAHAADRSATFENVIATLHDTACVNKALLDQILPQWAPQFKAGSVVITDKEVAKAVGKDTIDLCWFEKDGVIHIIDEIGNQLQFPKATFDGVKAPSA